MDMQTLARLRAPHPDQAAIDARSAQLLRDTSRQAARAQAPPDRRRRRRRRIARVPA